MSFVKPKSHYFKPKTRVAGYKRKDRKYKQKPFHTTKRKGTLYLVKDKNGMIVRKYFKP